MDHLLTATKPEQRGCGNASQRSVRKPCGPDHIRIANALAMTSPKAPKRLNQPEVNTLFVEPRGPRVKRSLESLSSRLSDALFDLRLQLADNPSSAHTNTLGSSVFPAFLETAPNQE